MTLEFLGSKRIQGSDSDTKPLNVPDGTIFYEIDGGDPSKVSKFVLSNGVYELMGST